MELTKHYLRYLKLERGYSPNTVEAYKHDLEWLLGYLEQEGLDPLSVKLEDLEHFAAMLSDHGISAKSQARILSGVRSFYRYLVLDGYLDVDPTELLESPHLPQHLPEYLSTEEVDALENSIDLTSNEGHRNRAIIEVFFSCGLRVSELTNLKLSDLFLSQGRRASSASTVKAASNDWCPSRSAPSMSWSCGSTTGGRWKSSPARRTMSFSTDAGITSRVR